MFNGAKLASRFSNMPDATKAMQQIDGLEIANQKISVKIAAMSAAETAAAAMASQVDLDGAEGASQAWCAWHLAAHCQHHAPMTDTCRGH